MNIVVKQFIEDYIILIESRDFEELFDVWLNHEAYGGVLSDRRRIRELLEILENSGVSFEQDTVDIRKRLIREAVSRAVQDWIDDLNLGTGYHNWLGRDYILDAVLMSGLGLPEDTLNGIIDNVALSKGLIIDNDSNGFKLRS